MKKRNTSPLLETTFEIVQVVAYFLSLSLFTFTLLKLFVHFVFQDSSWFDYTIFSSIPFIGLELNTLSFLIINAVIFGTIGWIISFLNGEVPFIFPFRASLREILSYLLIAYFFSLFFSTHLFLLSFVIFLFLFPQLVTFFVSFRFIPILQNIQKKNRWVYQKTTFPFPFLQRSFKRFSELPAFRVVVLLFFVAYILFFIGQKTSEGINLNTYQQHGIPIVQYTKGSPYITRVTPTTTTTLHTVELDGYDLGSKNDYNSLHSNWGDLPTQKWENNRIIFVVPSYIVNGDLVVWIDKSLDNLGNITGSNRVILRVEPRTNFYFVPGDTRLDQIIKTIRRVIVLHEVTPQDNLNNEK